MRVAKLSIVLHPRCKQEIRAYKIAWLFLHWQGYCFSMWNIILFSHQIQANQSQALYCHAGMTSKIEKVTWDMSDNWEGRKYCYKYSMKVFAQ